MKKVLFAVSVMAAMAAVSCSKEKPAVEATSEPEYYEVKIGMGGAITSEMLPLTKSNDQDFAIGIDVWSCKEGDSGYVPYAYGYFDVSDDIAVRLVSGYKYKFTARTGIYGDGSAFAKVEKVGSTNYLGGSSVDNQFHYSNNEFCSPWGSYANKDIFYGETQDYIPSKNGIVSIEMNRVSFGLQILVSNLTAGSVSVKVSHLNDIAILSPATSFYSVYTMNDFRYAYSSTDYFEELTVAAELTNADNVTIPLGSEVIKVQANKLIKVKINATAPSTQNAFSLQYSDDEMVDDEEDTYEIGGGESIDTPIE